MVSVHSHPQIPSLVFPDRRIFFHNLPCGSSKPSPLLQYSCWSAAPIANTSPLLLTVRQEAVKFGIAIQPDPSTEFFFTPWRNHTDPFLPTAQTLSGPTLTCARTVFAGGSTVSHPDPYWESREMSVRAWKKWHQFSFKQQAMQQMTEWEIETLNRTINQSNDQSIEWSIEHQLSQSINQSIKRENNTEIHHVHFGSFSNKYEPKWQIYPLKNNARTKAHPVDVIAHTPSAGPQEICCSSTPPGKSTLIHCIPWKAVLRWHPRRT